MSDGTSRLRPWVVTSLALSLGLASCDRGREGDRTPTAVPEKGPAKTAPADESQKRDTPSPAVQDARNPKKEVTQPARPELEKQRQEAEQQAQKTLDQDAITAVEETEKAARASAENNPAEALAAIERASGKISVLLARNPAAALVPVRAEVEIIDGAPQDLQAIKELERSLERAVNEKNYPAARILLLGLTSEIRARTFNLPLATYPAALKEAARLIDEKKTGDAARGLQTALNTLVVVDRVTPLPLVLAQSSIAEAQALRDKDKDGALRLLATARTELDRTKELGYLDNDPEYAALSKAISDLESQIKGKGDTSQAFSHLKDRIAAFFKRHSERERR